MNGLPGTLTPTRTFGRISGQTWISIHDCPLSESTCKLLNRVVPNGTPDCLTISIHGIIRLQDMEIGGLITA